METQNLIGNRVWLDADNDGVQDSGERGMGGVCIRLLDATGQSELARTSTDSNGFYAFDVDPFESYIVEFDAGDAGLSPPDVGDEDNDSDANPTTGRSGPWVAPSSLLHVDAGVQPTPPGQSSTSSGPQGEVGPVRSARLVNIHIHDFFQDSCLIYAGSTREIRDQVPHCAEVFREGDGGVGAMLDVSRMVVLAEKNGINQGTVFNYTGNVFSEQVPPGGYPAIRLDVYVAELNQSAWIFDSASRGWLRYVDSVDKEHPGLLHPDTDRITDRQLYFDNIIVLYVEHEVLAPAIIDMYLQQGETGDAVLFRDGMMYELVWSTRAGTYEQRTGLRRPLALTDESGNPFPLRPGRSWFIIATPFSELELRGEGSLRLRIVPPEGAGDY